MKKILSVNAIAIFCFLQATNATTSYVTCRGTKDDQTCSLDHPLLHYNSETECKSVCNTFSAGVKARKKKSQTVSSNHAKSFLRMPVAHRGSPHSKAIHSSLDTELKSVISRESLTATEQPGSGIAVVTPSGPTGRNTVVRSTSTHSTPNQGRGPVQRCQLPGGGLGYPHVVTQSDVDYFRRFNDTTSGKQVGVEECWVAPNPPSTRSIAANSPKSTTTITTADGTTITMTNSNGADNNNERSGASTRDPLDSSIHYSNIKGQERGAIEGGENVMQKNRDGSYTYTGEDSLVSTGGSGGEAELAAKNLVGARETLDKDKYTYRNRNAPTNNTFVVASDGSDAPDANAKAAGTPFENRAAYKRAKSEDKKIVKEDEKIAKAADEKHAIEKRGLDIRKDEGAEYGGLYGGASVSKTIQINGLVDTATSVAEQGSAYMMQRENNAAAEKYSAQGNNATGQDAANAEATQISNGAKASTTMGLVTSMMAIVQGKRVVDHMNSIEAVGAAKRAGDVITEDDLKAKTSKIDADYNSCVAAKLGGCAGIRRTDMNTVTAEAEAIKTTTQSNRDGEVDAQKAQAFTQGVETAKTMLKATNMYMQANSLSKAAATARAVGAANNGFMFNPGQGNPNNHPDGTAAAPETTGALTTDNTTPDQALDAGNPGINPGAGDNGIAGDGAKGAFVAATPAGGGAGAGGGGLGTSGGTAAAKDDGSAKGGEAPGKQQGGGGYASDGGSGGSGYKGSAGHGGAVGMDNSFADMLKKFLPGGEDDKGKQHEKAMAFDDRSPASDQAAVISRNKNIFEEIHKRYQKKSGEGAIVF